MRRRESQSFINVSNRTGNDVADHVINPVAAERLPHIVEFTKQPVHDLAFTGVDRTEIPDHHFFLLAVAVDATHALFEAVGIPGKVVVHHQRTELKIDALACCFCGNHHRGFVLKEFPFGIDPFL